MRKSKKPEFTLWACLTLILLEFVCNGKVVSQDPDNPARTVKIGLLIQDSTYTSAVQGAELAISKANGKGGLDGRQFQLVVRSMEGPWGTGSKQAVDLIFEEKVWALLGSHDGRNAHLVEQAATKSQLVFVSAWSGDPTLTQAFVPWFFNCVPNDNQQSVSLVEELYLKRKLNKIAIVCSNDYDSKMILNSFIKSAKASGQADPVQYSYDDYMQRINVLSDEISRYDPDCIVLFCPPSASSELLKQLKKRIINRPFFGSICILNENELSDQELKYFDGIVEVPCGMWSGSEERIFIDEFQKTYGRSPGMVGAYSFDAMNVLLQAVRTAGVPDREKIQKSIENMRYEGVTGLIQFDNKGNRSGRFEIMKTKDGLPLSSK